MASIMGGNAIKTNFGIEAKRVSTTELLSIFNEVEFRLKKAGLCYLCDYVKFPRDKEDHGDIDIVVSTGEIENNFTSSLKKEFKTDLVFKNDQTYSVFFRDTQVDLIFVPINSFYANLNFRNFSPFGNIFSRLLKQLDVSWKTDGLYYVFRYKGFKKNIFLTRYFRNILQYGGLKLENYGNFRTQESVFEFVTSSPFFKKEIYFLENSNHVNKKRDAVRKDYNQWNEYILNKKDNLLFEMRQEDNLLKIARKFPKVVVEINSAYSQLLNEKERSSKFNGVIVQLETGLRDEELRKTIEDFKETKSEGFEKFLDKNTRKEVVKNFRWWFRNKHLISVKK